MVEEWCGDSAGRLIPLCLIPLWDADLAAAEVHRNASPGGSGRVLQRDPPAPGFAEHPLRALGPVLRRLRRVGHRGLHAHRFVIENAGHLWRRPGAVAATLSFGNAMSSLADFLFSGVLVRFPDLNLAYSEGQIGWLPYILERADDAWRDHRAWTGSQDLVPEPPSTYYFRQVYGCFFKDQHGLESLDRVGIDNITFETDYPHTDSTWPDTKRVAETMMADLSDEQVYKIVRGNAIRMLHLDLDR